MQKYSIPIILVFLLVAGGIGGLYYSNTKKSATQPTTQGHSMETTSDKSIAQSHPSYRMEVTSQPNKIDPNQPVVLRYTIKNNKGEVLKNYSVVHEKIMHFIVVRRDLQYFQHLHPKFNKDTGEYTVVITFPADGPYRLFPDFTPAQSEDNPQQLTVTVNTDVTVGDMSKYTAEPVTPDTSSVKTVDGYMITYIIPSNVKAQTPLSYNLNIEKNGQPVNNLENYLGALGHGVILRADNLDFIHTHAGEVKQGANTQMDRGSKINFSTTFPESGIYRIFTQFQHLGKVITTNYAIIVK